MHRNGQMQHGVGDILTLLGTASESQKMASELPGTASESQKMTSESQKMTSESQKMTSESQKMASESQKMASELPGTPSQRRVAAFGANAGIAQRLAAAQLAIHAVLENHDLQIALAAYGYGPERIVEGKGLRDQAQALQQQQRARYGEQYGATDAHAAAQAQAQLS